MCPQMKPVGAPLCSRAGDHLLARAGGEADWESPRRDDRVGGLGMEQATYQLPPLLCRAAVSQSIHVPTDRDLPPDTWGRVLGEAACWVHHQDPIGG